MANEKKCGTCNGFGLWGIGDSRPMGVIDATDGMPTQPCPECGADKNPIPHRSFSDSDR